MQEQDTRIQPETTNQPIQQTPGEVKQPKPKRKKVIIAVTILVLAIIAVVVAMLVTQKEADAPEPQAATESQPAASVASYRIVDTAQGNCYNDTAKIACPEEAEAFYGQDAQFDGNQPSYTDNGDGTVTDEVTGLMWQQDPGKKITYDQATSKLQDFELAGQTDWRIPTIKELYSLIQFNGTDPSPNSTADQLTPFIDTDIFNFSYGDESTGDRVIDSQWVTNTVYESTVMNNQECFFGVNFADGRIKCYPSSDNKTYYVLFVRGDDYGTNQFTDNGNGTITDAATGLTWQQEDNKQGVLWADALSYCSELDLAEQTDWRVPNAKELQSIVDYSRSPDTTDSAAINELFSISTITNEKGEQDYPFTWTSTSHLRYPEVADQAVYISFGRALGNMNGNWLDVHGAGAQRSDPKDGVKPDQRNGFGPQGDARRAENYVRCVRGGLE